MRVCNGCKYLNIDEIDQDILRKTTGVIKEHRCNKYFKKLWHNSSGIDHDPNIYPCPECKDGGVYLDD